jgi:hypothetical protein
MSILKLSEVNLGKQALRSHSHRNAKSETLAGQALDIKVNNTFNGTGVLHPFGNFYAQQPHPFMDCVGSYFGKDQSEPDRVFCFGFEN